MINRERLEREIKENTSIKRFIHSLIINPKRTQPRFWIKLFINPFFSKRGKGSIIKWNVKMNVSPINKFALGCNSIIEDYSVIDNGVGDITIESDTRIGLRNTVIGPVFVGKSVIIAQNVVLSGLNHNYLDIRLPIRKQGVSKGLITIGDHSWIGANSVVTAGVTIGKHCVVAAGSVVTKDIPDYCVAVGAPARVIKQYDFEKEEWVKVQKK